MRRDELLELILPLAPAVSRATMGHIRISGGTASAVSESLCVENVIDDIALPESYPDFAALKAALSGLSGDDVSAKLDGQRLLLSARGRRTINCTDAAIWPSLPPLNPTFSESVQDFSLALAFVKGAASEDAGVPGLNGVHLNGGDVVATDRYRLRIAQLPVQFPTMTLPSNAADYVAKMKGEKFLVEASERRCEISCGGLRVATPLVSEPFPPSYRRIIPEPDGPSFVVSAAEMAKTVNAVTTFADSKVRRVQIAIEEGAVALSSPGAVEPIDVGALDAPPMSVSLNGLYLAEMLSAFGKEDVRIVFTQSALRGLHFSDSAGNVGILLPMKD